MIKKYGDDKAGLLVVALGWYGFTSIYPLLLVVVTVLGFVGQAALGHGFVTTLHQFPVIGDQFTPGQGGQNLHGGVLGLVIGVAGLLNGSQGVTQTAQQAMANGVERPRGAAPRLSAAVGPQPRRADGDRRRISRQCRCELCRGRGRGRGREELRRTGARYWLTLLLRMVCGISR